MKKTKEECLLMNGIMSFDLGKNEARIMKAMDDWAEDVVKNNLVKPDVMQSFSPAVAKCLVNIRKALLEKDTDEAWHWLYQIASPNFDKMSDELDEYWNELEKVAVENIA